MILNETMVDIADAIREKTGKSELIKPVDFATEIKGITSGGGESGGSNEYEYYALTDRWFNDLGPMVTYCSSLVKTPTSQAGMVIAPTTFAKILNNNEAVDPVAVALDMSLMISAGGQQVTIKDVILADGTTEEGLAKYRITKEEFYNLE